MTQFKVELRSVLGTQAAMGWAGGHTMVVDRPAGKAGGLGLGFNGAELLALAIGGCLCNDLRYVAEEMDTQLSSVAVSVTLDIEGHPMRATQVKVDVSCEAVDGSDTSPIVREAARISMAANSVQSGVPVTFLPAP